MSEVILVMAGTGERIKVKHERSVIALRAGLVQTFKTVNTFPGDPEVKVNLGHVAYVILSGKERLLGSDED